MFTPRSSSASRWASFSISSVLTVTKSASSIVPQVGRLDAGDDHLQLAVVDLRRPLHAQVVAGVDRVEQVVGGVPEHAGQRPGLVGQAHLQVQIAVAIGAELLVGDEKDLVDLLAFVELVDEAVEGH